MPVLPISRPFCLFSLLVTALLATAPASEGFLLTEKNLPAATIVLPVQTEYPRFLKKRRAWLKETLKKRHRDLTPEAFDLLLKKQVKRMEKRCAKIGDEEEKAARELQDILKKISGATLPIVRLSPATDPLPPGAKILLGSELARQAGLGNELDELDPDGLICRVLNRNQLVLTGRRARGTLYAVYAFLESLGCRWVMPGPFGELYPSLATIHTRINIRENPSHRERYFWCTYGYAKGYRAWTLRNRGNFVRALGDPRVRQSHALGQPLRWGATQKKYQVRAIRAKRKRIKNADGSQSWKIIKEEQWTLPDDYYARQNGKLSFNIPNMSNPRVWDLYADYYINWFDQHPLEKYASMSAEDGLVNDERPETRKLDSLEFDPFMGAYSATDRLFFFLNRIIKKVARVYPEKRFGVLIYSNNLMPPRMEQVNPKMALVFAPLGISPLHDIRNPKSKTNREYRKWITSWLRMAQVAGAETYYYDYEPMGYCWNMAMICPRWGIIGRNYPGLHKLGLDGHTTQGYDDWAACGLDNYLMERLYWNVNQTPHTIIADYAKARFGAAAPAMIRYYTLLEERMEEIPDLYSNEVWDNHLILTPEVRKKARAMIREAVQTADTERARAQVHTMALLQESTDAFCDAIEWARETGNFGEAAEKMKRTFEIRDELNKLYPNFMNAKRLDDKAKPEFFTGGIYNQYRRFQQKIDGAAASLLLPRFWQGMLDTDNIAISLGLQRPGIQSRILQPLDVTVCPDVIYHTQREPAAFFYRTEIRVPDVFSGKRVFFYFPSIIARGLQIWVNGKPVLFDNGTYRDSIWRGPATFWYNYNHQQEFEITPHIQAGKVNTLAFRVYKALDFGGTYRRIFLLAQEKKAAEKK